ncbi:hypothetical protein ACIBBB_05695 [Streptomyces sp. NPDC051217]|uniref:hypothetical protein n=1 Tax=Streptomyces sp. NPDC051217 TaxID=3365644 RepID=UPI00379806F9
MSEERHRPGAVARILAALSPGSAVGGLANGGLATAPSPGGRPPGRGSPSSVRRSAPRRRRGSLRFVLVAVPALVCPAVTLRGSNRPVPVTERTGGDSAGQPS